MASVSNFRRQTSTLMKIQLMKTKEVFWTTLVDTSHALEQRFYNQTTCVSEVLPTMSSTSKMVLELLDTPWQLVERQSHGAKCYITIWLRKDLPKMVPIFPTPDYAPLQGTPPLEMFETFSDDKVVSFLANQSRQYALFKNESDPSISEGEPRVFTAMLILTSSNTLPGKRQYWEATEDI